MRVIDSSRAALCRPSGASVDWMEGSALDLPFPSGHFDVVLCQLGLQFFPDQPSALRELRRVGARAGRDRAQRLLPDRTDTGRECSDSSGANRTGCGVPLGLKLPVSPSAEERDFDGLGFRKQVARMVEQAKMAAADRVPFLWAANGIEHDSGNGWICPGHLLLRRYQHQYRHREMRSAKPRLPHHGI